MCPLINAQDKPRPDGVVVCGSRTWTDGSRIYDVLRTLQWSFGDFTVIHGNAKGADRMAGYCARVLMLQREVAA